MNPQHGIHEPILEHQVLQRQISHADAAANLASGHIRCLAHEFESTTEDGRGTTLNLLDGYLNGLHP